MAQFRVVYSDVCSEVAVSLEVNRVIHLIKEVRINPVSVDCDVSLCRDVCVSAV